MKNSLREYVRTAWDKAVTELKTEGFSLPFPFVPPCIDGEFRVLYYWDTYFTNVGLLADGRTELARGNVDDLLHVLELFGCVPNCAKEGGADYASQPPLLGLMIQDIYARTGDDFWLEKAVLGLEKEYLFWMRERMSVCGLNQYRGNARSEALLVEYYDYVAGRIGLEKDLPIPEKTRRGENLLAEGESGEDFTPRYDAHRALDFVQVDLNAHLYGVEDFLCRYFAEKDEAKSARYGWAKERRRRLLQRYCYDQATGIYHDYDFVHKKRSRIVCAGCFLPYFYGIAGSDKGLRTVYARLKSAAGVYACEAVGDTSYQWGYPNIWAPHQYFAYKALRRYGCDPEAKELTRGYVNVLEREFERTGRLWERYTPDGVAPTLEYETQPMLGWTAGVYNYFGSVTTLG